MTIMSPVPVRIDSTGLKNSCYDFRVERNGRQSQSPCELTYNLNDTLPTRRLLRMREADSWRLFPELQANREFEQFRHQVRDLQLRGIGNMSIAKGLVLDQYESDFRNANLGIAVHRMGPVPVFLVPATLTGQLDDIEIYGTRINPVIGVYPKISTSGDGTPTVFKQDLLRSFNIQLDTMLLKYLEDVGEHLHDIENYLPRIDVLSRAKQAETVLKQSIDQKIQLILKHTEANLDSQLHPLAKKVWTTFSSSIVTAGLARVYALYFMNELYRILGIKDKSTKYEQDWGRFVELFSRLPSESDFEDLFRAGSELFLLRETRAHYLAESEDSDFEALYAQAETRGIRWLLDFVSFARFVAALRRESPAVGTGRLFISLQHNVTAASDLFKSVKGYIANQRPVNGQPRIQVFAVNNENPGANFERLIKTRIWLSDALIAVIPKDWATSATAEDKDLTWVVKEIDYALLLDRLLRLFIEDGVDRNGVAEAIVADIELIAPTHARFDHGKRKERRLRLMQNVSCSFAYRAETELTPDLQAKIDLVIRETRERHARDVIIGFFRQFEDPEMVARILSLANFPRTKKWICERIADDYRGALTKQKISSKLNRETKLKVRLKIDRDVAKYQKWIERRFELARVAVANRGLTIGGQDWHLLQEFGLRAERTYKSNLHSILVSLLPDGKADYIDNLHDRVFRLVKEASPTRLVA